ncbi:MAG TPA: class I SAM-dependent methyltransferase [Steroidobacter sp.]
MTITADTRQEPRKTLQDMEVHAAWTRQFRTSENDAFYNLAFDHIATLFGAPDADAVLDAGCGSAIKSLHLARRGYRVHGIDFSAVILEEARKAADAAGFGKQITFAQADLTALTLPSASVKRAVCWGVLMHIPDIEKAVAELARVIAPGGRLVISEGNYRSLQARTLRALKRLLRRERAEVIRTPAGIEFWEETGTGRLMTRQADIPWLIAQFERHGLRLVERRAGQFSEIYMVLSSRPLRKLVHAFNNFWFRHIRWAGPAFGNMITLERPG